MLGLLQLLILSVDLVLNDPREKIEHYSNISFASSPGNCSDHSLFMKVIM